MTLPSTDLPAGFTLRDLDVAGRTVPVVEAGDGPALLVLHGAGDWLRNATADALVDLATDHRLVAPQLPGLGGGSGDGISSLRDLSVVGAAVMDALAIERYSVLGTSVGAAVALWVAIDHAPAVERMVLEAPAAFRAGAPPPSGPPPGARDGGGPPPERLAFLRRIVGQDTDPDLVAAMPGCAVPALVLFGDRDPLFPVRFADHYSTLPACNVAIVYRAGHDIKADRPQAFTSAVRDYLARGPGFVVNRTSALVHD